MPDTWSKDISHISHCNLCLVEDQEHTSAYLVTRGALIHPPRDFFNPVSIDKVNRGISKLTWARSTTLIQFNEGFYVHELDLAKIRLKEVFQLLDM